MENINISFIIISSSYCFQFCDITQKLLKVKFKPYIQTNTPLMHAHTNFHPSSYLWKRQRETKNSISVFTSKTVFSRYGIQIEIDTHSWEATLSKLFCLPFEINSILYKDRISSPWSKYSLFKVDPFSERLCVQKQTESYKMVSSL